MSINAQPFAPTFKLVGNLQHDQVLVFDVSENAFVNTTSGIGGGVSLITDAQNTGTGYGLFDSVAGSVMQFKSIIAGSNISVVDNGVALVLNANITETLQTGTNIGTGAPVFKQLNGNNELEFKSIAVSNGLAISDNGSTLTISLTAAANGTLVPSNNLSDLTDDVAARRNLGVYSKVESDAKYIRLDAHSVPSQNNMWDIGSPTRRFNDVYGETFQGIAILADDLTTRGNIGDVLTFNGSQWVAAPVGSGGSGTSIPQTLTLNGTSLAISGGNSVDLAAIDTNVDLSGYATTTYVNNAVSNVNIDGIASDTNTNTVTLLSGWDLVPATDSLQSLGSPTNRFTNIYLDNSTISIGDNALEADANGTPLWNLEPLATRNYVDTAIANISTGGSVDLTNYYTKGEVDALIPTTFSGDYNDLTNTPTIPSLAGYATQQWVIDQGFMTGDSDNQALSLVGTVLSISNGNSVDLAAIDTNVDLTNYYTKSEVDVLIPTVFSGSYNDLTDIPSIPDTTGLASETYVDTAIAGVNTFSGDYNDLTNKPTLFSGSYNDLTDIPQIEVDLSAYALKTELFSGDYADLLGTPVIPDTSGFITEAAIDAKITSAITSGTVDLSGYYTKTEVDGLIPTTFSGDYNDLTNTPSIPTTLEGLTNVSDNLPVDGQHLVFDGANNMWKPANASAGTETAYGDADARQAISSGIGLSYNSTTGVIALNAQISQLLDVDTAGIQNGQVLKWNGSSFVPANDTVLTSTDQLPEGTTNKWWTDTRFDSRFSGKSTSDLSEGANLYFTNARVDSRLASQLVPGTNVSITAGAGGILTISAATADLTAYATKAYVDGVVFSGSYSDLTGAPTLFDGDYNSLLNKPTIPSVPTNVSELTNDAGYLTSIGAISYNDLTGAPSIPTDISDLSDNTNLLSSGSGYGDLDVLALNNGNLEHMIPSNDITYDLGSVTNRWRDLYLSGNTIYFGDGVLSKDTDGIKLDGVDLQDWTHIKNKPDLGDLPNNNANRAIKLNDLSNVSLSGDYADLTNTPSIPADISDLSDINGLLGSGAVATTLFALTDTNISSIANDQILTYNTASGQWRNVDLTAHPDYFSSSDFDTSFAAKSISDLGDVDTAGIQTGQFLQWDGTKFVAASVAGGGSVDLTQESINELSDVDTATSAPVNGDVLTWNSTSSKWQPAAAPAGSGGTGASTEYFKLNYATNGALTSITNATSGVSATILSTTGGDVEITFSGYNFPPSNVLIYGYAYQSNEYVIMPLNKDITTRVVAGGGSAGNPVAFGNFGSTTMTLKLREADTGASRSFGTATHAWIVFSMI